MKSPSRRAFLTTAACAPVVISAATAAAPTRDPVNLGVQEAARLIQAGELKAEDYAARLLEHADKHKELNAWVAVDRARVLEQARAVDQARARGEALKPMSGYRSG